MAKHRHRSGRPDAVLKRSEPLASLLRPLTPKPVLNLPKLSLPDARLHHPENLNRPLLKIDGRRGVALKPKNFTIRAVAAARPKSAAVAAVKSKIVKHKMPVAGVPARLQFSAPKKVVLCVKRKMRREVIFAKNKAGGGPRKKPRRTMYSSFSC